MEKIKRKNRGSDLAMTTEQREAIEAVEEFNNKFDCGKYRKSIDTALSLIKEQQKR